MASTYTSRIRLEKQADGENPNSWGLLLNQNVIDLVDEAVAGFEIVSVDNTPVTLTNVNGGTDQARKAVLDIQGTLTADVTITFPAQEKTYFIHNGTTGDYNILLKYTGGTAVTATGQGLSMMLATDGSNNIRTIKSEDNDTKIFSPFITPSTIVADTSVNPSVAKSIYQRVNTSASDITVSVSIGSLTLGQYVIVDKVTTTNKMIVSWATGSQGITLSSATDLAIGIYNGVGFSFTETIKQ